MLYMKNDNRNYSPGKKQRIVGIILIAYGVFSFLFAAIPAFMTSISSAVISSIVCVICIFAGVYLFKKAKALQDTYEAENNLSEKENSNTILRSEIGVGETLTPEIAPKPIDDRVLSKTAAKTAATAPENEQPIISSAHKSFENFHVAGTSFREKEIVDLGYENADYEMSKSEIIEAGMEEERIYKFLFAPQKVELIPEPENPHDPNAIKVCMDGIHVGYIKKGSISRVKNLLAKGGKLSGEISGGPYKYVYMDEDSEKYETEKGTAPYSAVISITK